MAVRKIKFVPGGYYHIFNRGVDKRKIFLDEGDQQYFLDNLIILNRSGQSKSKVDKHARQREKQKASLYEPIVEIVALALLPNHFHLLLKEIIPGGITKFMQKLGTSYSRFFNEKYERSGALFQGRFKAKDVADLVAVSAYVNLNFVHHGYDTKKDLVRTSYFEYVDPESVHEPICNKEEIKNILDISGGVKRYISDAKSWSKIFVDTHKEDKNFDL